MTSRRPTRGVLSMIDEYLRDMRDREPRSASDWISRSIEGAASRYAREMHPTSFVDQVFGAAWKAQQEFERSVTRERGVTGFMDSVRGALETPTTIARSALELLHAPGGVASFEAGLGGIEGLQSVRDHVRHLGGFELFSTGVRSVAQTLQVAGVAAAASPQFEAAFADTALGELIWEYERGVGEADESALEQLVGRLQNLIVRDEKGRVDLPTFLAVLSLLLTVLIPMVQAYQGRLREQQEDARFDSIDRALAALGQAAASVKQDVPLDQVQHNIRVVARNVHLRARPSTKARSLRVLFVNEQVVALDARGKWLHVQAYDYLNLQPIRGWVFKKYLVRIDKRPSALGD